LVLDFFVVAPQAVNALYVQQIALDQKPYQLLIARALKVFARLLVDEYPLGWYT